MDETAPIAHFSSNGLSGRRRIGAVADGTYRRPIVLVLGMHRSGTSLCSNIVSVLGVDMTDNITGPGSNIIAEDNAKGHWERWEIVEFHDRILDCFNRKFHSGFHDFPLPPGWWAQPQVVKIRREIVAFLTNRMGDGPFGFKDPRTVRLMPMWRQIFAELKLAPRIVLCLRNPVQVGRSLQVRDQLDPAIGEYRWLVHMIDFFRYIGDSKYCVIEYEKWFDGFKDNYEKLTDFIDIGGEQVRSDVEMALRDIVDSTLRHDNPVRGEATQPLVRRFYRLALAAEYDNLARQQIQELVSQFVGFDLLQRPFHRSYELAATAAARVHAMEGELAALRTAVSDGAVALEAANARSAVAEESIANANEEINSQSSRLGQIETARDAAVDRISVLEVELAEARAQIEAQTGHLDEIEAERGATFSRAEVLEAELAEARVRIEAQRAHIAKTEMGRDAAFDRVGTLEAELAGTRTQVEAQSAQIAEIEKGRDAAFDRVGTLEAELAGTRTQIEAQSAQIAEIEKGRGAALDQVGTLQAELARTRTEIKEQNVRIGEIEMKRGAALDRADALEAELAEARTQIKAERGSILERIGVREAELAEARTQIEAQSAHLAEIEKARDAALERAGALEAELFELRGRSEAQGPYLAELESERDALFTAWEEASALADQKRSALADTLVTLETAEGRLAEYEAQLADFREREREMATALAGANEGLAATGEQLRTVNEARAERELVVAALERDVLGLRGTLTDTTTALEIAEGQARVAEDRLTELRSKIEAQNTLLAQLELARRTGDAELTQALTSWEEMREETEVLKEQLAASRRVVSELLAAFRGEPQPVPEPRADIPRGWRALVFGFVPRRRAGASKRWSV